MLVLGMARMLLGALEKGISKGMTWLGEALVSWMTCVTYVPDWGRSSAGSSLKGEPALPAWASATAFTNLVPCGVMVMPFMDRMLSSACTASARVSSFCVRMLILVAGRLLGFKMVLPVNSW